MKVASKLHLGLLGPLCLLVFALGSGSPFSDPGFGWHLKTGEWIFEHFDTPRVDPFLVPATDVGRPWIANQWLADLLSYLAFASGSFSFLHAWVIVLALTPTALMVPLMVGTKAPCAIVPSLVAFSLIIVAASLQWFFRPVLFSFLFFSLFFYLAQLYERNSLSTQKFWAICFFGFMLWANLHPGFPVVFLLLGTLCGSFALKKNWRGLIFSIVALLLAFLGTLINPYGFDLYRNISSLMGSSYFMGLNTEWLPPNLSEPIFWGFLTLSVLSVVAIFRGKASSFEILSIVLFLGLSFLTRRYITFFSLASAGAVLRMCGESSFGPRLPWRAPFLTYTASVAILLVASLLMKALPGRSAQVSEIHQHFPVAAVKALPESARRIFASPDLGGLITWLRFPKAQVFIDDRNELSGEAHYQLYFRLIQSKTDWNEFASKWKIDCAILNGKEKLVADLSRNLHWQRIYSDEQAAVFCLL